MDIKIMDEAASVVAGRHVKRGGTMSYEDARQEAWLAMLQAKVRPGGMSVKNWLTQVGIWAVATASRRAGSCLSIPTGHHTVAATIGVSPDDCAESAFASRASNPEALVACAELADLHESAEAEIALLTETSAAYQRARRNGALRAARDRREQVRAEIAST